MDRLTRQGVRDLDGPQKNQRRRRVRETCFHEWEHDPDCGCYFADPEYVCRQRCRRCGETRTR